MLCIFFLILMSLIFFFFWFWCFTQFSHFDALCVFFFSFGAVHFYLILIFCIFRLILMLPFFLLILMLYCFFFAHLMLHSNELGASSSSPGSRACSRLLPSPIRLIKHGTAMMAGCARRNLIMFVFYFYNKVFSLTISVLMILKHFNFFFHFNEIRRSNMAGCQRGKKLGNMCTSSFPFPPPSNPPPHFPNSYCTFQYLWFSSIVNSFSHLNE